MTNLSLSPHHAVWLADRLEARAFTDLYAVAPNELQSRLGLQTK